MRPISDQIVSALRTILFYANEEWGDEASPHIVLQLGSGMDEFLASEITHKAEPTMFSGIPGFPSVPDAKLILGMIGGKRVAVLTHRSHTNDGTDVHQALLPLRTLLTWGVKTVILTSGCGALRNDFLVGSGVLVCDHVALDMHQWHPLYGDDPFVANNRHVQMFRPYDRKLRILAMAVHKSLANKDKLPALKQGVLVWRSDPTFETEAERLALRHLGDVVGPSIVPEVIAARRMGCTRILAITCVGGESAGDTHNIEMAREKVKEAREPFGKLLSGIITQMDLE